MELERDKRERDAREREMRERELREIELMDKRRQELEMLPPGKWDKCERETRVKWRYASGSLGRLNSWTSGGRRWKCYCLVSGTSGRERDKREMEMRER